MDNKNDKRIPLLELQGYVRDLEIHYNAIIS